MGQPMAPNYNNKDDFSVCDIPFHTLDEISDKIYSYLNYKQDFTLF